MAVTWEVETKPGDLIEVRLADDKGLVVFTMREDSARSLAARLFTLTTGPAE